MSASSEHEARRLVRLYQALDFNVLAARGKQPLGNWKAKQHRLPTDAEWGELEAHAVAGGELFLCCGVVSGVVVADLDSEDEVAAWRAVLSDTWETFPRAVSPRGGIHLVASVGSRQAVKSLAARGRWDFQADGKGVILPSGKGDRVWEIEPTLDPSPDMELFESLLSHRGREPLPAPPPREEVGDGELAWRPLDRAAIDAGVARGGRDDLLYRLASSLRSRDVERGEAEHEMRAAWVRLEQPVGDEISWASALEKLDRVYREIPAGFSPEFKRVIAGDSEEFFDGKRFAVERLARTLADAAPVAVHARTLYTYRAGLYRHGGEADMRRRIQSALPDRWTVSNRNSTIEYLLDSAPELNPVPPMHVVNVRNGLLDVRTRELKPHTPEHLHLVQVGAWYDSEAECPHFDLYLEDVLPDPQARSLFCELAGLLLVPDMTMQKAVMLLGEGGTGKSVALSVLVALLGAENCSAVPLQALGKDRFIASRLLGKLANIAGDLDAATVESTGLFKSLTGGDLITAQEKFKPAFEFRPYCRLVYSANVTPPTKDATSAYFDRFLIIPFTVKFRGTDREDRGLSARLTTRAELSGVLNRALDGLDRLRADGFSLSAATVAAASQFRRDADSVAGFLGEMVSVRPGSHVTRDQMYSAYRTWCTDGGQFPVARRNFTGRFRALLDAQSLSIVEAKARRGAQSVRVWRNAALEQAAE